MDLLNNCIRWCEGQRDILKQQIEMLESGIMKTGEMRVSGMVDTTEEGLIRAKRSLSEIDSILRDRLPSKA